MSVDPLVAMRISQMKQDIEKVKARQISNQAVIGGVTDHLYLSNRGTYTHAQLDVAYAITYSLYSTVSILNVTATSAWNKAVSAYSVGSAAYVEAYLAYSSASTANTAAASAWAYASSAFNKAVSVASTASTHYANSASFHGFSIASHGYGTLYDNGTNYAELEMGPASYIYTSGGSASSPYWKAPSFPIYVAGISIPPAAWYGLDGFVVGAGYQHMYEVSVDDTDARIMGTFYVASGGSFVLQIAYNCTASLTCNGGLIYSCFSHGQVLAWTSSLTTLNLAATVASTTYFQSSSAFTVGDAEEVGIQWQKNNDPGTGTFKIHGIWLVKQ